MQQKNNLTIKKIHIVTTYSSNAVLQFLFSLSATWANKSYRICVAVHVRSVWTEIQENKWSEILWTEQFIEIHGVRINCWNVEHQNSEAP